MAARYDHIDFTPPAGAREEAQKGLDWRSEYGRGGTEVGVARGRDLSNGVNISPETARRMKAYFDRHEIDKQGKGWSPGEDGFPSNGRIAWALWGGDPGYAWSRKLVEQMNAADEEDRAMEPQIERRALAIDDTESASPPLAVETRCEEGSTNERQWIVGYAAKFNSNSLEIEGRFVERLLPTAFNVVSERRGRKKPLETRALWNHDSNFPLARYPGTLKLTVDEVGLRYEFPVPDTSYGRDLAANIKAGIVRGSSFAFQVAKDGESWTTENGRSLRVISAVESVIDVGPVTYPAYPDADVKVAQRSFDAWHAQQQAVSDAKTAVVAAAKRKAGEMRAFMERRGFCPTGVGGGRDNSCSSKGGGGGGGGGGKGSGGSDSGAFSVKNAQRLEKSRQKLVEMGDTASAKAIKDFYDKSAFLGGDRGEPDLSPENIQRLERVRQKLVEAGDNEGAAALKAVADASFQARLPLPVKVVKPETKKPGRTKRKGS